MKLKISIFIVLVSTFIFICKSEIVSASETLPKGFEYADKVIPDLIVDSRYYSTNNFIGERIEGYLKPKCILTTESVESLAIIQNELRRKNMGIKVYDCYRPQQAVDQFVRWAKNPSDNRKKQEFYPNIDKKELFREGYIYFKSSHSRGSAVDITLVKFNRDAQSEELDMGTPFDFYDPESSVKYIGVTPAQRENRMQLQRIMMKYGFVPYSREWWHFTLKKEPFKNTYFNFPVK